ncbi:MAG: GAF domain-containing protein [Moraxellaceae bacterium]|nr:GAF domain-containing protein [Moraxellaceae bacterium]
MQRTANPSTTISTALSVNIYAVIASAMVMAVLFAAWTSWSGYRITRTPAQIRTLLDVRVQASESHIYLEEYLGGDSAESPEKILGFMRAATQQLAVLEGSVVDANTPPLTDADQRAKLRQATELLNELTRLTRVRIRLQGEGAAGSEYDLRFDTAFDSFLESCKALEDDLHAESVSALRTFILMQTLMTLLIIAMFSWLYRLLRNKENKESVIREEMQATHAELLKSRALMQEHNLRQEAMLQLTRKAQSAIGVEQFSHTLLTSLCDEQNAIAGMVWLSRHHGGLEPVARWCTHGSTEDSGNHADGLVAQVAHSGKAASYATPPRYLRIESGLVSANPGHVMVLPVRYQSATVAVFELAFIESPAPEARAFIEEVLDAMAVRYFMFSHSNTDVPADDGTASNTTGNTAGGAA